MTHAVIFGPSTREMVSWPEYDVGDDVDIAQPEPGCLSWAQNHEIRWQALAGRTATLSHSGVLQVMIRPAAHGRWASMAHLKMLDEDAS